MLANESLIFTLAIGASREHRTVTNFDEIFEQVISGARRLGAAADFIEEIACRTKGVKHTVAASGQSLLLGANAALGVTQAAQTSIGTTVTWTANASFPWLALV